MPQRFAIPIAGALAFVVFLAPIYSTHAAISIRSDAQLKKFANGFYPVEEANGSSHAWTSRHATLDVRTIDRRIEWRLTAMARVWRPAGVPLPALRIRIDGDDVFHQNLKGDLAVDVPVPPKPGARSALITFDTTPPFAPGGGDSRDLGVALESIQISPVDGTPLPPLAAVAAGALAIAALAAFLGMLGVTGWQLATVTVLIAWSQAWLLGTGIALQSSYALNAAWLAGGLALAVFLLMTLFERNGSPLTSTGRGVAAISLVACYLKLLVLLHPNMPIGDGMFHAHRLGYVLDGRLYFTSLAPGDFAFPYPVLLYVVAAPFSFLAPDALDRVALLRIVTTVADAGAGAMLAWMAVRTSHDPLVGLTAVVWYHIIPMTAWIMTWGNLTNAFGQSLFVASLALVVAAPVEARRRRTVFLLATIAGAAMLSHPSTFAILAGILTAVAVLYAWRGGSALRSSAVGVGAATLVAIAAAIVLYYAWFPRVYVSELGRVVAESAAPATVPAVTLGGKLTSTQVLAGRYFGWALLAASVGLWQIARHGAPLRLTLALLAWAGVCFVFLVIGVLSPMELRYHFAAFPALALLAGYASAWGWRSRIPLRFAAALVVVAGTWTCVQHWLWVLSW